MPSAISVDIGQNSQLWKLRWNQRAFGAAALVIAARRRERERPDVGIDAFDVRVAVVEAVVLVAPVQRAESREQREREVAEERVAAWRDFEKLRWLPS